MIKYTDALIKCQACGTPKDRKAFYLLKSGRASPYCIACNTDATLHQKYKRELRTQGVKAFTERINRKEYQLNLMLKAVVEFQTQEGKI